MCIVVVPKSGFAIAVSPFQWGFARSRMESGISPGETRFLLTSRTRALAAKSVQVPSGARKVAGISAALGETYGSARLRLTSQKGRTGPLAHKHTALGGGAL